MRAEEWLELAKDQLERIDNSMIYYPLKQYKVDYIQPETVKIVKACLLVNRWGLDITTNLISLLTSKNEQSVRISLHTLGDKKVLDYVDLKDRELSWNIHPEFMALYVQGVEV